MNILNFYKILYSHYGPQGWWPVFHQGNTAVRCLDTYHPDDYSVPVDDLQRDEIIIGAVLTQNTAWTNVQEALLNLYNKKCLSLSAIQSMPLDELAQAIRPSGFFNQKTKKLKILAEFTAALGDEIPRRGGLLELWGLGPETVDDILLYAYKQAYFVIDAYTIRISTRFSGVEAFKTYGDWQRHFMQALPNDWKIFQEYHALFVIHAKKYCKSKPLCPACFLYNTCVFSLKTASIS